MYRFLFQLGGDASAQLRYVLHQAELLNSTQRPSDIELNNLDLKELLAISSEYMTYEGKHCSLLRIDQFSFIISN
jgi:hypothetical protein